MRVRADIFKADIFKADIQSLNSESIDGAATIVNGVSGQEKEDWAFEDEEGLSMCP